MRRPRRLRRIYVKTCALAEIVAFGIGYSVTARTRVGRDDDDAVLRGVTLRTGFGNKILLGAGEARQPIQHRTLLLRSLRR